MYKLIFFSSHISHIFQVTFLKGKDILQKTNFWHWVELSYKIDFVVNLWVPCYPDTKVRKSAFWVQLPTWAALKHHKDIV